MIADFYLHNLVSRLMVINEGSFLFIQIFVVNLRLHTVYGHKKTI